jgi:protein-S-isoprenylcysteine O-methyltransferase Ste14
MQMTLHDRLVRVISCLFFAFLSFIGIRSAVDITHGPQTLASATVVLSKICIALFYALIVWFTLRRDSPSARARGVMPRLTAFVGSFGLMLSLIWLKKAEVGVTAHVISAFLTLLGSALVVIIITQLGRSFSIMAEARQLVATGFYRSIRHPLYLAEAIATVGVLTEFLSWSAVAFVFVQFACQVQRMLNEERVLLQAFPSEYSAYMKRTSRLIPGVW